LRIAQDFTVSLQGLLFCQLSSFSKDKCKTGYLVTLDILKLNHVVKEEFKTIDGISQSCIVLCQWNPFVLQHKLAGKDYWDIAETAIHQ